jgi:hypothetical protein
MQLSLGLLLLWLWLLRALLLGLVLSLICLLALLGEPPEDLA